ncbi:hypothetical protein BOTBODRAFT_212160 [Botryobasidium botryosum FD-172 SS1]|uniref:EF-hand domain-containing protein n=1 Tax=Botryobasidium botryosum (strain FD-172 SS1) TaxID=930990 RepID=A0A067ND70_BOTB1|nr:hypothetical protein BOTBODRAFT_212160 [Botryobasidium botryosum FD-172 SS1]
MPPTKRDGRDLYHRIEPVQEEEALVSPTQTSSRSIPNDRAGAARYIHSLPPLAHSAAGIRSHTQIPLHPPFSHRSHFGNSNPDLEQKPRLARETRLPEDRPGFSRTSRSFSATEKQEVEYRELTPNAEPETPKSRLVALYKYLLSLSIVTRWIVYILPILALIWLPGAIAILITPNAKICQVGLARWSVWLTVAWISWWGSLGIAMALPSVLRWTFGVVILPLRKYIDWLNALEGYMTFAAWATIIWISWSPIVSNAFPKGQQATFPGSIHILSVIANLLFANMVCSAILLGEKFSIQWIAYKFHQQSYEDRINRLKAQVECLVTLYESSHTIPGQDDPLSGLPFSKQSKYQSDPLGSTIRNVRGVTTTTTAALGNIASQMSGSLMIQPNSPAWIVSTALYSPIKTKALAHRIFYSFCPEGAGRFELGDIARFFPTHDQAQFAFATFDKEENGDVTLEEVEVACQAISREQLCLVESMADVDSAVGRLDNILMSVYTIVVILFIAVALNPSVSTLLAGAGTFVLGLSWLIGATASEVLNSIIFLFVKHPFDIGDNVQLDGVVYTIKEMRILSTIMVDPRGCNVQVANSQLCTKPLMNIRRSGQMSEPFQFDVEYTTADAQLQALEAKMLEFVTQEKRDFLPSFELVVLDIPDQEKLVLSAQIQYKSSWQEQCVTARRRNKWVCALKATLAELKIFGPGGDPDKAAPPQHVSVVGLDKLNLHATPPTSATSDTLASSDPTPAPAQTPYYTHEAEGVLTAPEVPTPPNPFFRGTRNWTPTKQGPGRE